MPTQILVLNKSWLVTGAGAPEGKEAAPAGSLYLREDGAPGSSLYVKEGGSGTTGWRSFPAPPVSYVDLTEAVPGSPLPDVARLYGMDANGYTVFEVVDSAGRVLRPVRDNILIAKVVEPAGVTRGQLLYVSGASGSNVLVRLAKADSSATMPVVGLAMDAAANNGFIRVMLLGRLDVLDTSARTEGEHLYVSATTAGAWTNVPPSSPALLQQVGIVARQHATNGEMLVLVSGALQQVPPVAPLAWVNVPFNAADFTATGGTWTVAANQVLDFSYLMLSPTAMMLSVNLSPTTVTAGIGNLKIKIPNGKTSNKFKLAYGRFTNGLLAENRRELIGLAYATVSDTVVTVLPVRTTDEHIATLVADTVDVAFQLMLEVV